MAPPAKKVKTSTAEPAPAPKQISGDSLEEDFLLEDNFVPSSDDDAEGGQVAFDPAEDVKGLLSEDDEPAPAPAESEGEDDGQPPSKKRKASPPTASTSAPANEKKKKKEKKPKAPKAPKADKLAELGINPEAQTSDLGLLPLEALVDALAEKQKRAMPKLSAMEMEDYRIPGTSGLILLPRRSLIISPPLSFPLLLLSPSHSYRHLPP